MLQRHQDSNNYKENLNMPLIKNGIKRMVV